MSFDFAQANILSADQFDVPALEKLFALAKRMKTIASGEVTCHVLEGKQLGSCFFEESTRTRWSSESAFMRLGGSVITMWDPRFSSMFKKKETFEDTIKVLSQYVDVIVLRHPQEGKATIAAQHSDVPVINAGDGKKEHPTQALLDVFTIQQELGRLRDFRIAMVGDLSRGRTVHSLVKMLKLFPGVSFTFVASDPWQMPAIIANQAIGAGCEVSKTGHLETGIVDADVVYMVRPQNERSSAEHADIANDNFYLNRLLVKKYCKDKVAIMHPLPRNEEISPDVDDLPNAAYFRQVNNGTMIRMALYILIFDKENKFP